ncbi:MAG TPA: HlyD family secretion protein [Bryobacteraceae bacterium]|nr:HlyD family secretion protein [Bryobacteraceae bacterium]
MAETTTTGEKDAPAQAIVRKRKRSRFRIIGPILLVVLAVAGYFLWQYFSSYESTDDAQVDGHLNAVSARINGQVSAVLVKEEQIVKAGDVLVRIDPRDYQVAVEKAEADLADAEAALASSRTDVPITSTNTSSTLTAARSMRADAVAGLTAAQRQLNAFQARQETSEAQVGEAQANYKKAADDTARYKLLVAKDEISQQIYDQSDQTTAAAKAAVTARTAAVNEARQNVSVAEAAIEQAKAKIAQADAAIQAALTAPQQVAVSQARARSAAAKVALQKAALDQARLNLSYCTITAPVAGIVDKKTVEVGDNVSPGQQLLIVVPLDDIWVTANFKETQLRGMRPGQKVRFSVDAYGREYTGRVTGVGGASGSRLSLLPPENATGNYVKVVQRIPVRVDLDPGENKDHRLRVGMSVDPKVYLNE